MTSTEFSTYKMTVPGYTPFAGAVLPDPTAEEPGLIEPGATTGAFSMPDGFDSTFDSAPTATGSSMVQRGQINYIGKMASYVPFAGKVGFDYWGFDPAVATEPSATQAYGIGGYPKGAILTLVKDGCYLKVISLQDNNKVDFTGQTDTSVYTDVVNGTVDGVNWQYLSLDPQTLIDQSVVAEIPGFVVERELTQVFTAFKASNDAVLVVSGGFTSTFDREEPNVETSSEERTTSTSGSTTTNTSKSSSGSSSSATYSYELSLIVSNGYSSLADLKAANWSPVSQSGTTGTPNGTVIYHIGTVARSTRLFVTEAGKYYALGFYGYAYKQGGMLGSGIHPLAVRISASTVKVHLKVIP